MNDNQSVQLPLADLTPNELQQIQNLEDQLQGRFCLIAFEK